MTARPVLLDGSFLDALLDNEHPSHTAVVDAYASLIDNYQAGADRLFALSTVLSRYPRDVRRGALAPIDTTWVSRQHRGAVSDVTASSPEVAMTLLMLRRERFKAVATTLHDFDQFEIEVLGVAPDTLDVPRTDQVPDGYVRYETEPMPARQPTDG